MKKIFLYTACLLILSVFVTNAKDFKFCVLGKKGVVQVKTSKSKKYIDIKTGDKLLLNDNIKLDEGAYVGLVHTNGKTLELTKPGNYKVSVLSNEAEGKKTSVLPKLADMIFSNVDKNNELFSDKEHKSHMKSGGYIERGIGDVYLPIISPAKTHLLKSFFTLCWNSYPGNPEFEFRLMNRFNKVLLSKTSQDTCIQIDANALKLEKDTYYFWSINLLSDKNYKSQEACFKLLSDKDIVFLNDTLKQLREEIGDDKSATSKIILAYFYEQNNLMDEANNAFEEAIRLAPDVYDYVVLYEDFLSRTKLAGR